MFAVKIETTNDRNGNPRRGWFVYASPGACLAFVEEGQEGQLALTRRFPAFGYDAANAITTLVLRVPPSEYVRAVRCERERSLSGQNGGDYRF